MVLVSVGNDVIFGQLNLNASGVGVLLALNDKWPQVPLGRIRPRKEGERGSATFYVSPDGKMRTKPDTEATILGVMTEHSARSRD